MPVRLRGNSTLWFVALRPRAVCGGESVSYPGGQGRRIELTGSAVVHGINPMKGCPDAVLEAPESSPSPKLSPLSAIREQPTCCPMPMGHSYIGVAFCFA